MNDDENCLRRIMEVHVEEIREQVLAASSALRPATGQHGVCPMATSLIRDGDSSVYESLFKDERVCRELASNITMAQFRTGIDSVRATALYHVVHCGKTSRLLH